MCGFRNYRMLFWELFLKTKLLKATKKHSANGFRKDLKMIVFSKESGRNLVLNFLTKGSQLSLKQSAFIEKVLVNNFVTQSL
jgi:hypothetical protein